MRVPRVTRVIGKRMRCLTVGYFFICRCGVSSDQTTRLVYPILSSQITTEVVNFLLEERVASADVRSKAIEHVIDGIGVILAGSRTECAKKLTHFIHDKGSTGYCTLLGFGLKAEASDAALINGTSGHADDYDDTQLSSSPDRIYGLLTHPTVPVLAAALAVGENVRCSGGEFLEAFIAGFEVECKLAETIKPEHYKRGFHTTGTIGAFGAAAASSRLLGLNEKELRHALGITASMAAGIRANFGTMTKPLHAGMAASHGVVACLLAKEGFTADTNVLDGRWGFMEILGQGADTDKIVGKLGRPYSLMSPGASVKMYPCGSLAQPSMDKLLEIVSRENLKSEDVCEIRLRAGANILEPLRYTQPTDELQAKFSLQFGLASILLRRRAGLREYSVEFLNNPRTQEAMKKVRTILDPEVTIMGTDRIRSIIEIKLKDGRVLSELAEIARGTPERPLTRTELYEKFRDCTSFTLSEATANRVFDMLGAVDTISSVEQLTTLLS